MQTLEEDLARLLASNQISESTAMAMARNPQVVRDRAPCCSKTARPSICERPCDERTKSRATLLDMDEVKVDPAWALRVPASLATRRQVLPFAAIDGHVYVACANDQDQAALQAVERYVKHAGPP